MSVWKILQKSLDVMKAIHDSNERLSLVSDYSMNQPGVHLM